uniref:Uncharacterized protein n=1 Tax=Siphoviridae sp. ctXQq5 TaxID=2826368 RepID=A0A8S5N1I7_9CAUD|nr:MAG TPA: hypothetical protein [Siphoviridae sp. ctXQq5]
MNKIRVGHDYRHIPQSTLPFICVIHQFFHSLDVFGLDK